MILDILPQLHFKKIILASRSPRRKKILQQIGLNYLAISSDAKELGDKSEPVAYAEENAKRKGLLVSQKMNADLIIAADTVVYIDSFCLEKPKSKEEARLFLERLSGKKHTVITGVSLHFRTHIHVFHEKTFVFFNKLPKSIIDSYVQTKKPYDKAGGYGIQEVGATFIEKINGCYFNVIGLPAFRLCQELRNAHLNGCF